MNYNLRQLLKISPCCGAKPIIRKMDNYKAFACSKCYYNFAEKFIINGIIFKFYEKYYAIQKIRYSKYSFLDYKNYTAIDFKSAKEVINYYRQIKRNICFE